MKIHHVNRSSAALTKLLTCTLLLAATLLLLLISVGNTVESAEVGDARDALALPKVFDFEHFKQLFKKSYSSLTESLARKRLYLARALKVFLSAISYKHRRVSSYLSINHMSDWTPEEVAKTHLGRKVMEELLGTTIEASKSEEVELADEEDISKKLADIVQNQDSAPGYKEIAEELRRQQQLHSRKRRQTGEDLRELPLESLIGNPEVKIERSERIKSNNPDYQRAELTSLGSDRYGAKTNFTPAIENLIKSFKNAGFVVSKINDFSELQKGPAPRSPDLKVDEVYLDHRDSNCLFAPRRQGSCGSCYAFAAVALYEWSYCVATNGKKVALSEQYVVDCGDRSGMEGCNGGIIVQISHFVNNYGLELRQHYPYRTVEDTCPYDATTPPKSMGYLRVQDRGFYYVAYQDFEKMLPLSPMLIGISVNKEFQMYGGGVDKLYNCDKNSGHAMLLIGHGREDGEEYWLIRNSYGADWGVAGHYKISKEALKGCMSPPFGYMLRSFEIEQEPGTRPVSQEVSDRYTEYLIKSAQGPLETFKPKPGMVVQD